MNIIPFHAGDNVMVTDHPRSRLPPLVMLKAFEAVGRSGSMRKAAGDIGVSHTVISRHVKNLERWIGCKLVRTGPRGVELTAQGEAYLAAVIRGFSIIGNATDELRPKGRKGRLQIWCTPGLATRWLIPRLSQLEAAVGTDVDIEITATDTKPDLHNREADVFVGFNILDRFPDGAQHLARPRMFPVVSHEWLRNNAPPRSVADLARHPLLHDQSQLQWTSWLEAQGHKPVRQLGGASLSGGSIWWDATKAGQGIALVNKLLATSELRRGELVELLTSNVRVGSYYLMHAPNRGSDGPIQRFSAWIRESMSRSLEEA